MNWKRKLLNKCTLQNTINIYQKTKVKPKGPKTLIRQPPPHLRVWMTAPRLSWISQKSENKLRGLYFSKAFIKGLIFGGAYVRREICVSKSIGLACSGKEIYHFCFVLLCIPGQIPSTRPPGGLYSEGRFNGGFLRYDFEGLIRRGLFSEFYGSFNKQSTRQWQLNIEIKTKNQRLACCVRR